MIEFEQDGSSYRTVTIPAREQFHLMRRVAPLIPPLVPAFTAMVRMRAGTQNAMDFIEPLAELLQPFADSIADMKDEPFDYVYDRCLMAVQRKVGESYSPVMTTSKVLMFSDLNDLSRVIPLIAKVLQDSLGPFIRGLLTAQQQTETAALPS